MNGEERIASLFSRIVGDWRVQVNFPLANLTTFRIGGPAAYVVTPSHIDELKEIMAVCREYDLKNLVLGKGSNILASDEGFQGVIIRLDSDFRKVRFQDLIVEAECGVTLSALAKMLAEKGLGGLEFASGIPGTLGGAVYMNAGAYGGELKDVLKEVVFLDDALEIRTLPASELKMGYRTSIFEKNPSWCILSAVVCLHPGNGEEILAHMQDYLERRKAKQPLEWPSAGSTFKRPQGAFAGRLIEDCGLRGFCVGGAQISEKHCGFVINKGGATCADVVALTDEVKRIVFEKTGFVLEREIRVVK